MQQVVLLVRHAILPCLWDLMDGVGKASLANDHPKVRTMGALTAVALSKAGPP